MNHVQESINPFWTKEGVVKLWRDKQLQTLIEVTGIHDRSDWNQ